MLVVNCRNKDVCTLTRVSRKLQNVRFMAKINRRFCLPKNGGHNVAKKKGCKNPLTTGYNNVAVGKKAVDSTVSTPNRELQLIM